MMKNPHRLTLFILYAMTAGLLFGLGLNFFGSHFSGLTTFLVEGVFNTGGKLFVACLRMLVVPLVLVSLIAGTAALQDVRRVGTIGLKTILLYLGTTAIAISMALGFAIISKPGVGIDPEKFQSAHTAQKPGLEERLDHIETRLQAVEGSGGTTDEGSQDDSIGQSAHDSGKTPEPPIVSKENRPSIAQVIIGLVPSNPVLAMAEGNMLQVIVFAILMGLALTMSGDAGQRVLSLVNDLNAVVMQLVLLVMQTAPVGVFCLVAHTFAVQGVGALGPLGRYFMVVLLVLVIQAWVTYPVLLRLLTGLPALPFLKKMVRPQLFAFSTASSNATLPVTLDTAENHLGIRPSVAAFTVPLGATINMDGTAIMQGVATVFIAQAWGIPLGFTDYLTVIATATLASIGTAGIPGVGLVMLSMVLLQVGLPVEGIAIIMGVDRILDMVRTAVNITGDCMVSSIVARWQGDLDETVYLNNSSQN
jgi:Na+/H+-dicarboxylate symporter